MRAVPEQIAAWVPAPFYVRGADGYGFSDTRAAARRHFAIDAEAITVQALVALADSGAASPSIARLALDRYHRLNPTALASMTPGSTTPAPTTSAPAPTVPAPASPAH